MAKLKEISGKYYEECDIVMLATHGKTTIQLDKDYNILSTISLQIRHSQDYQGQHLYALSNEEVKEGDYVLSTYDNWKGTGNLKPQLGKILSISDDGYLIDSFNGDMDNRWDKGHSKKIIATTDESLGLSKPLDSFILEYITEYNKGNQITKVLVEYEPIMQDSIHKDISPICIGNKLKIDSDNCITIKKAQPELYTREQVENLLLDLWAADLNKRQEIEDWIKENL